ncbi:RAMP superfamily CRISPR-associated protein [Vulcanisaeta distributa]|uniref:RAMP superfamily CRISPR-associated protein n=1 Tax=Vulcanisaeta distributa TaxID=164451 RepID=UPI0006D1209C|nr:RAMP superfamily CRISPR-associated protein [Vulcanisaeta distributa]
MEVLETGIAWDPYWNLPYIPSSSLKGAVRAAAYSDKSPCLNALGLQAESSAIIILDSYPVICPGNKGLLTLDIVNPHYSEVNGEISEAESSPNPPVILPTITKGVGFRIVILVAKNRLRERLSKCGGGHCNYVYLSSDCKNACTRMNSPG